MHILSGIEIEAKTAEVLAILKKNRETHKKILAEAREGYAKKAEEALRARLDDIRSGKIKSLTFHLSPPQDHTSTYDTVIQMLELHTEETIELNAVHHRNLVEDKWDWTERFLASNVAYSSLANSEYVSKYGGEPEDE